MYYFSCYLDQNHARVTSEFSLDFFPAVYFVISSFFFIHKRPWIRLAAKSHKCERFWGIKFPTHFRMGDERHRFQSFEQKNKNIPGTLLTKILKKELSQGELTFLRGNNLLQSSLKRAWDLIIGKKKNPWTAVYQAGVPRKKVRDTTLLLLQNVTNHVIMASGSTNHMSYWIFGHFLVAKCRTFLVFFCVKAAQKPHRGSAYSYLYR